MAYASNYLNANYILRQEEQEAANGESKNGKSKYGAKKVNFTNLKKLIFEELLFVISMLIDITESLLYVKEKVRYPFL